METAILVCEGVIPPTGGHSAGFWLSLRMTATLCRSDFHCDHNETQCDAPGSSVSKGKMIYKAERHNKHIDVSAFKNIIGVFRGKSSGKRMTEQFHSHHLYIVFPQNTD